MRIPVGAVIVSAFAIAWTAVGARSLPRKLLAILLVAAILISAALIYVGAQIAPGHPPVFNGRTYSIAVALEAAFIVLAVVVLRMTNRKYLLLPVISIIVGLHFFGMVAALGSGLYWWIGAAMCALPIITLSISPRNFWDPVVGLGCAVILWFAVICAFF